MENNILSMSKNITPLKGQIKLAQLIANSEKTLDVQLTQLQKSNALNNHLIILKVLPFESFQWIDKLAGKFGKITVVFFSPSYYVTEEDTQYELVKNLNYTEQMEILEKSSIQSFLYDFKDNSLSSCFSRRLS
jgi:hypothetical protein